MTTTDTRTCGAARIDTLGVHRCILTTRHQQAHHDEQLCPTTWERNNSQPIKPRPARQIRGAIHAAKRSEADRHAWVLQRQPTFWHHNGQRTPLELVALVTAHHRLVANYIRRHQENA